MNLFRQFRPLRRKAAIAAAIMAFGSATPSIADDIDLYTGGEAATGGQANVLIVLDNSANWNAANQGWPGNKQGQSELEALSAVASTLGDSINVGLAFAAGTNGGYIRYAIREMNTTNRTYFTNLLNQGATDFDTASDRTSYWQVATADTHYEGMLNAAWRYFNGVARFGTKDLPQGSDPDMRDYDGNSNSATRQPAYPNSLGGYSLSSSGAAAYSAPNSVGGSCAKNFIIFIGNGYPSQFDPKSDLTAAAALIGDVPDVTDVSGGDNTSAADEWTRYMYNYGVKARADDPKNPGQKLRNKIATYTIDVCKDACDASQATLLKSMAKVGGGKYFKSTSKTEIQNALALIFAEIQAVNSVFASATLPISVNTQGTYENQVYIGVFRPDAASRPRWYGNLKEYKFGRYCDRDRNDKVAIDTTRVLKNGMIDATLTGDATGTLAGSFTGTLTDIAGVTAAASGTVTGSTSGSTKVTLAATMAASAGTTAVPGAGAGAGTVTGTVTGTTGTSTFTGSFNATPSVQGTYTAADERIGDDVPAPDCGTDASGKIELKLYLGDKNGYRAIDEEGNTGFIDMSAKSYWTSDSTFWTATPNATSNNNGTSDMADGPTVERGAAAQRLRTHWAETAPTGHPDGRKVYTCIGNCLLSSGTAAEKTLSNNIFAATNSAVATALAAPSGSVAISLARSGTTVTATVGSGAHAFVDGSSVVIAGVTGAGTDGSNGATDYNGTKTVTTGGSTTTFTYPITETPASPLAGSAQFGAGSVSRTVTSIALAGTGCTSGACKPGSAATATLVASGAVATPANISGTVGTLSVAGSEATSFLNNTAAALLSGAGTSTVTYAVTLPAAPGAATGITATAGGISQTGMTATFDAANNRFTVTCPTCSGNPKQALAALTSGASVTISNSSDTKYNGTWILSSNATNTALTMTYRTYSGCSSGCGGGTAVSGGAAATETVTITRAAGATTASVTTAGAGFNTAPNTMANGSTVSITGATGYNASYTVSGVSHSGGNGTGTTTFTISGLTTGPAAAAGAPTATLSGAGSGPPTTSLINWTRGKDLWEDEDGNNSLTNVRASIHGDVLHARPVVVNYGSTLGVVGFYGSNDGLLRAIKGGTSETDGIEKWAFIPAEFMNYAKLARLYTNSEDIRFPNSSCTVSPAPTARNYFWDGSLVGWQSSDGTATTAPTSTYLFATMRRGGRALYALDVSNPDTPKFMWRITNASTGFSELGQTWSEPKIAKLKGTFTRADATVITNPVVLVFGAGYDAAQEDKPAGATVTPTMGRGVYVVEAATGQLIQFLQPTSDVTVPYDFPADVNVLDVDNDGYADRIYAGDTDANIFRFDTEQTVTNVASSGYWKRYHIATLGDVGHNGGNDARKFMFAPEVLPFKHNGALKTMVLVGSGNREKPLNNFQSSGSVNTLTCPALYTDTYYAGSTSGKIRDRFYGILDGIQSGADEAATLAASDTRPIVEGDMQQVNASDGTLTSFSLSSSARGWFIYLRNDPDGNGSRNEEKTVNAAKVVAGVAYFATNTPVSSGTTKTISSITRSGTTATVTTSSAHPFLTGDSVIISGAVQTEYNGSHQITVVDSSTFTYTVANAGVTSVTTTGTLTANGSPNTGVCSNLGEALGYAVDPFTGMPAFNRDASTSGGAATYTAADYATKFSGGGLPPTVTAGVVSIGGTPYRFIIGSGGAALTSASSIAGARSVVNLRGTRSRLYWSYGADN